MKTQNKAVAIAGVKYLKVTGFESRKTRRAASKEARDNRAQRQNSLRMRRPSRLDEIHRGHQKLCAFFNIAP